MHRVKEDRELIRESGQGGDPDRLLGSVIVMAHAIDVRVVGVDVDRRANAVPGPYRLHASKISSHCWDGIARTGPLESPVAPSFCWSSQVLRLKRLGE